jgi:hypothetical protein
MGNKITDYLLYRWRYILGYGVIAITIIGLLLFAGLHTPGGISQAEMESVVVSNGISLKSAEAFAPSSVINLPYNLLQRTSIELLGVNNLSIKLPSLILASFSVVGMILLLLMWFRRNVAVLTTILVITTGQFLFVAQNGTSSIVYVFWSVWLLVAAMMVSRRAKYLGLWKVILFSAAALSLYTPLSIYILLALVSAIVLHPHLRYLVRQLLKAKLKVAIALFFALIVIAPLIYGIVRDPTVGLTLLGVPEAWPDISNNILILLKQYFNFTEPGVGIIMTPVYSLGSMALIVLGIFRLATTNYTARSYIITAWVILLLPVLIITPNFSTITFVPAMLLMAMGISTLLRSWYQLFPRNPYARIAGLIPLVILIGGMFASGVGRYVYSYTYHPATASNFSHDLQLLNKELTAKNRPATTLIVDQSEKPFYDVVAAHQDKLTVTSDQTAAPAMLTIISNKEHKERELSTPDRIVTDTRSQQADRFYIYKTDQK